MLDQNTDRMWYVIGAVIIGAAIIFILNGTMPQLFASVGDTFEDKAKETTEIVDGIGPQTKPKKNYLLDSEVPKLSVDNRYTDYYLDVNELHELVGQTVTVSFEAKAETDGIHYIDTYFRSHDGDAGAHDKSEVFTLTADYQRYTTTLVVPDLSDWIEFDLSLRFRGNMWVAGQGQVDTPNENDFTTRRVKLELGNSDTGYIPHEKDPESGVH